MNTIPDLPSSFEHAACGLVTTEADGTICRANSTFCKWFNFTPDELIGKKKIQELFTVGGRFFHHTHWAPLLQMQGSVAEVQIDMVTSDGETLPMLINASRAKYSDKTFDQLAFFVATDRKSYERELIAARKSVEDSLADLRDTQKKLQESRDFLSIAIHSARMGIWSQDIASNQVSWSQELQHLTELTDSTRWATSEDFYRLIHEDDRSKFEDAIHNAIQTKSDYAIEFRLQHASGDWLVMEGRGHATYSDGGEVISVFGILIDISDRKATEKQLHDLNQQLSLADRRKDEFLATLGHELRNPLAPIKNVLEIMRLKETEDSFMHWSRDIIERHVSQMTHLIDDLMEVSRISQGRVELRKQQIDINEMMQNAVESSQALMLEQNHTLTVTEPEHPIIIDADPTRIIQIISNLLNNAAKYTPDGGRIHLRAFQEGDEVVLSVSDTGIGIPPEQLGNIFNMFSQLAPALERSHGGLGIGLALVSGLVKLHGGTISARSEGEDKGSEFIVRLPIVTPSEVLAPQHSRARPENAESRRILVIDDNVDAAESLAFLLGANGHTTLSAHDGITGVELAAEFRPEVILSDIGLPDITGYEVATRIRQNAWGKEVYLIATTGWGQDKDKQLAGAAGFDKHLTKPIDFQELNSILKELR
ncbi:PAS domain S-box protein [Alteromonas pelagimontana]|uniref:histidine kinase n=1 Tax=Alteromonas pelagimontana TaxID=1858656 RepID=A0A6M4MDY4_9ALTE|nr:ATP-binding protein [Alteromonas pelagimontana]QJR80356.1 PAS domain S-box protein [Alteromonas pelagimontana]